MNREELMTPIYSIDDPESTLEEIVGLIPEEVLEDEQHWQDIILASETIEKAENKESQIRKSVSTLSDAYNLGVQHALTSIASQVKVILDKYSYEEDGDE